MLTAACSSGNKADGQPMTDSLLVDSLKADSIAHVKKKAVRSDSAFIIATLPTIDALPLFIAQEQGLFEQAGLDVKLRAYEAQMDVDTAFITGWIDAMTTDIVRAERLSMDGEPIGYIAPTPLAWKLMATDRSKLTNIKQLTDKTVAMTRFSATHYLTDLIADSAKIAEEHLFRIQVNNLNVRMDMMRNAIVDALLMPEPQATMAANEGHRLLFDSRTAKVQLGVLARNSKAKIDTTKLYSVYNAACDSINAHGLSHYRSTIAKWCRVKPETVDSIKEKIAFPHTGQPRREDTEKVRRWLEQNQHRYDQ